MIRKCNTTQLAVPEEALDLPPHLQTEHIKNWPSYSLWGLLFYDDQPPWFVLLECLHILFHLYDCDSNDRLFHPPGRPDCKERKLLSDTEVLELRHEKIPYSVPRNNLLRHFLFRDSEITDSPDVDSWSSISDRTKRLYPESRYSLDHLPKVFADVGSFRRAVSLLRTAEIESLSGKRWTSKHLLPLGRNMLFADISTKRPSGNADRRFMRRSGEMLYLMLGRSRSELRARLATLLKDRLLRAETPYNKLARLIGNPQGPGETEEVISLSTGYLPLAHLYIYDQLAEDWIALLDLRAMPMADLLDPLMRISALNLLCYLLHRSHAVRLGQAASGSFPPFVFDLSGSVSNRALRVRADAQYDTHLRLPKNALDEYFESFSKSSHWKAHMEGSHQSYSARSTLKEMFGWSSDAVRPSEMLREIRAESQASSHSVWSTIAMLAKRSGMAVSLRGVGTWYAPDGAFLESLVLANVRRPIELSVFLDMLYSRYRIIVGQKQALKCYGHEASRLEEFKENEHRLEDRLSTLGFVDRKSDACAFVRNPFYQEIK